MKYNVYVGKVIRLIIYSAITMSVIIIMSGCNVKSNTSEESTTQSSNSTQENSNVVNNPTLHEYIKMGKEVAEAIKENDQTIVAYVNKEPIYKKM